MKMRMQQQQSKVADVSLADEKALAFLSELSSDQTKNDAAKIVGALWNNFEAHTSKKQQDYYKSTVIGGGALPKGLKEGYFPYPFQAIQDSDCSEEAARIYLRKLGEHDLIELVCDIRSSSMVSEANPFGWHTLTVTDPYDDSGKNYRVKIDGQALHIVHRKLRRHRPARTSVKKQSSGSNGEVHLNDNDNGSCELELPNSEPVQFSKYPSELLIFFYERRADSKWWTYTDQEVATLMGKHNKGVEATRKAIRAINKRIKNETGYDGIIAVQKSASQLKQAHKYRWKEIRT